MELFLSIILFFNLFTRLSASTPSWNFYPISSTTSILGLDIDETLLSSSVSSSSYPPLAAATSLMNKGASIERYENKMWKYDSSILGALLFDVAISSNLTITVGLTSFYRSIDHGHSYELINSIIGTSQSLSIVDNGKIVAAVGSFTKIKSDSIEEGVAISADSGLNWEILPISVGNCRYGSFPSLDTWYITSGDWATFRQPFQYTSGISISTDTGRIHIAYSSPSSTSTTVTATTSSTWGAISKTTDGGQSWTTVFSSPSSSNYYFNAIDCSSPSHCVAVTEGNDLKDLHAFVTFDGGKTWIDSFQSTPNILPSNTVSLMCASWVGTGEGVLEGWLGGAAMDALGRISGLFFHTTDGGLTYSLQQTLENCFPLDMDFSSFDYGAVSCVSSTGLTSTIALYQ